MGPRRVVRHRAGAAPPRGGHQPRRSDAGSLLPDRELCSAACKGEQLSRPVGGVNTDPAAIGVYVDVAAAYDGDYVSAGEAVTVFEDRRDAECSRRFDDEASVVEEHTHTVDDRCLVDQDGVVNDQEE